MLAAARCNQTPEPLVKDLFEGWEPAILLRDVLRKAGEMFRDQFTPRDLQRLSSGERRWKNNLRWAFRHLCDRESLRRVVLGTRVAPGQFQITNLGWQRVASLNQP